MRVFWRNGVVCAMSLICWGVLLPFSSVGAESTELATEAPSANVVGFRSAHFGMSVKDVEMAIEQDFSVKREAIQRERHPMEKTDNLWVSVDNLLPDSGLAKVYYIFGFESKQLIQVNILWGYPASETFNAEGVVAVGNQLREHFIRKGFEKEGLVVNAPLGEGVMLMFRGKDARGRMVVVLLTDPVRKEEPQHAHLSLRVSYIANPDNPDVFRIKDDEF